MSKKASGINYSKTAPARSRRERVIQMLKGQLKVGTKRTKKSDEVVPLLDKDVERIKKELSILDKRV